MFDSKTTMGTMICSVSLMLSGAYIIALYVAHDGNDTNDKDKDDRKDDNRK